MNLTRYHQPSPIGTLLLVYAGLALRALDFHDYEARMHRLMRLRYGPVTLNPSDAAPPCHGALNAYFAGDLTAIDTIEISIEGTAFQQMVWTALRRIPATATTTYGRLAAELGRPTASRAVGLANGSNPIAIVIPCHRLIGSDAGLTGYGGGLARKSWLLAHERQSH